MKRGNEKQINQSKLNFDKMTPTKLFGIEQRGETLNLKLGKVNSNKKVLGGRGIFSWLGLHRGDSLFADNKHLNRNMIVKLFKKILFSRQ